MWCDNCFLVFPLRGGAIAWAVLVAAYSIGGGIFLLTTGQYFFFFHPEWQIYGGVGIGIGVAAVLSMLALSNRSYIWIRVVKFLWPFVIVLSAVRATIMIVQLQRGKDKITWSCNNGGQMWTPEAAASTAKPGVMPGGFCVAGFNSLNLAFIISLLFDVACQMYMYFLCWRFSKRLEHYSNMNGPYHGGYYKA
ncbi:hypothetical protein FA15DRAFT_754802 [Coprinopsis marcescibilis]|uniref:Uncharacterized protein n=1 Tax=Coprinopsis marcescibilis TaxID=230819 RepID=A0A5C3LEC8_COPMA|nr:hypothetical protein FA15DRAFT_754802 [Coprinopsis marcescibilis]